MLYYKEGVASVDFNIIVITLKSEVRRKTSNKHAQEYKKYPGFIHGTTL
jgi:hypothetical protein